MGVLLKLNLADLLEGVKKKDPSNSCAFVVDFLALLVGGGGAGESKDIRSKPVTVTFIGV